MGSVDTWVGFWGRRGPDRPAVAAGPRVLTWGSLAGRSSRLAAGLAAEGARRGSRIGVLSGDPAGVIEVIAACARLGAVAVPLDPGSDPGRLRELTAGAGLWALMSDPDLAAIMALGPLSSAAETGAAQTGSETGMDETGMDEPLLLLHTRGTTGAPKAAVLSHGNVEAVAVAAIAADGLVPPDCAGIVLPSVATPAGLAAVLGALHAGALIRFGDDDPAALLGAGVLPRPTVLVTTCEQLERPGVIERLAADGARPAAGGTRLVKVPGPVPGTLRQACRSAGIPLVETYGLAEGGGLNLQQSPFREPSDGLVPLLGQQARVVDAAGATAPAGQPGELVLAGSAITGDGWLHTGDLAVEGPDGSLTILGRHR
jgi:acyl-CoA synthetase (AMP-forming)/AMP-acid ligase II